MPLHEEAYHLLMSLGRALVSKGLKFLPGGSALVEIAVDTWEDYRRNLRARPAPPATHVPAVDNTGTNVRIAVEALVRDTPSGVRAAVDRVVQEVAGQEPPEARQALASYLVQVPAMMRRSLRRPTDPTGTTLPGNLVLRKGEDLVALLPVRPSRFHPGDRPLPGVDWVLEDMLGVGGFGEVWKARHAQLKGLPPVALKFCLDDQAAKALRNEAGVLDQVMQHGRHEGIVQLRQAYLQAATPCLEYEYIAGGDLAGLIHELHQQAPPSGEVAGKIMRRLAEIIGSVHQQRPPILHRDLKPANILVQKSTAGKFSFKVADFGIGHVTSREAILTSTRGAEGRSGLLTNLVQGSYTPLYASPQQMRGDPPDARDDVYALGVIWYQLLTGDLGTGAPSGMRWTRDLAQRGLPAGQIDLLASCFESNPAHRPAHAGMLAEELARALPDTALPFAVPIAPVDQAPVKVAPDTVPRAKIVTAKPPPLPPLEAPGPERARPASTAKVENDVVLASFASVEDDRQARRARRWPERASEAVEAGDARPGAAAAFWFLLAGIGTLVLGTFVLAMLLGTAWKEGAEMLIGVVVVVVPILLGALFHFLACAGLHALRGKGRIITAIVFGFILSLMSGLGTLGCFFAAFVEPGVPGIWKLTMFLLGILTAATAFCNVAAAVRGILAVSDAAVNKAFNRPDHGDERHPSILPKNLLIPLTAGLGVEFVIVFLLALAGPRF